MSNNNSSSGTSIVGLLGVAFVVLKLTKVINWSWWYVTIPFWGSALIAIPLIIVLVYYRRKNEKEIKRLYQSRPPRTKSKFQERLEEMQKQKNDSQK